MADRPILFSAPMVLALLAGTKTQTRRLIKVEAERPIVDFVKVGTDAKTSRAIYEMKDAAGQHVVIAAGKHFVTEHYSPPIAVGDRLWVKEAHHRTNDNPDSHLVGFDAAMNPAHRFHYDRNIAGVGRVTFYPHSLGGWGGRASKNFPSLHMPRWASRITLLVDDVRVERLQDISKDDAIAEGVVEDDGSEPNIFYLPGSSLISGVNAPKGRLPIGQYDDPRLVYRDLVNNLHGGNLWTENPWVVAYTFRVVLENIDYIGRAA